MNPKVMLFVLFHLVGDPGHPSPMLSHLGKRGTTGGSC
jgi:hypothetical protein